MSTISIITLRDRGPEDEAFCFRLYSVIHSQRMGLGHASGPQIETLMRLTYRGFSQTYAKLIPPSQDLIILREDQPVGRLIVLHLDTEIRVADIALLPEFRNQGIGTHCLQRVIDTAREKTLPVRLQTAKENGVQRLYSRLGFVVTRRGELDHELELNPYGSRDL